MSYSQPLLFLLGISRFPILPQKLIQYILGCSLFKKTNNRQQEQQQHQDSGNRKSKEVARWLKRELPLSKRVPSRSKMTAEIRSSFITIGGKKAQGEVGTGFSEGRREMRPD